MPKTTGDIHAGAAHGKKSAARRPLPQRASTPSPVRPVREIPQFRRFALAVSAGGRCEFDGHNKYLLRHPLTLTEGNFAQVAHIVAFSAGGPRGKHPIARAAQGVNDVRNLMLLCPECHKLIDDHPEQYTVGVLRAYKTKHEKRIEHLTSLRPDSRTTAVVLRGNVAGQKFSLPPGQLHEAVAPRYPESDDPFLIDLSTITDVGDEAYLTTATRKIDEELPRLYADRLARQQVDHISVFAIASIPVLIHFGSQLSDKVPTSLYQRHRGAEDWKWREKGIPAHYKFSVLRQGTDAGCVAFLLPLSGSISVTALPVTIDSTFTLYELKLASATPHPQFLSRRADLDEFEREYQIALRVIAQDHPDLKVIHLIPAVPAPVAVTCGRALLRVDSPLLVYDFRRAQGYVPTITVTKGSL